MGDASQPQKNSAVAPFLKWAGGKRWLAGSQSSVFPTDYQTYFEPFLGGGAVFFHLQPKAAVLSDINAELIEAYRTIRDSWRQVRALLGRHNKQHGKKYYYKQRNARPTTPIGRTARFLYLNRTCWNGLYRVNLAGEFNVPIGTKSAVLLDSDDFSTTSMLLKAAELVCCDFEVTIGKACKDDFVFADPPYTVMHNNNGFLKYNDQIFSWEDQVRLRDSLRDASSRGVKFALTNANHESVRSLYAGFEQIQVARCSVISGDAEGRGRTHELLVKNY